MVAAANLVEVAALVGDTARATMLNAFMGGEFLTATELAYCANISRATASGHLSKLVAARLRLERGRFVWPSTAPREGADRTVTITPAQLGYLLEGIDWRLPQHTWRPHAAG